MNKFFRTKSQHGFLALLAVILIVIIGTIGAMVSTMFFDVSQGSAFTYQADSALYLAESGLEHATHKLLEPTVADRLTCSGLSIGPISQGNGTYSVSSDGTPNFVSSPTALSSALTAIATSIPVISTTGYASSGRIMIDGEFINYTSVSSTSFNNVTRGVDSTIAAAHVSGAIVSQYQCALTSLGGVPNLTSPAGKRTLTGNATLQFGLAMGDASGGNVTIAAWNESTEATWNNLSTNIGSSVKLLGADFNSYADGWLVGSGGSFVHWGGSIANTSFSSSNTGSTTTIQAVRCNSKNDCHAVGNFESSDSLDAIFNWTGGTQWQEVTLANTAANKSTNYKSIDCDSTSDCWAVGNSKFFFHWNGTTWTSITQTLTVGSYFSVYCNSATDCWAVGNDNTFARLTSGTTWTDSATTLPSVKYNSIFCNASNDCWAVGDVSGGQDVIAHWNGTAWSQNASNPTPIANLNSVECFNTNDCWSVGSSNTGTNPAFVHWDGTSWTQFTGMANGALPTGKALQAVILIGPHTKPMSNWNETIT